MGSGVSHQAPRRIFYYYRKNGRKCKNNIDFASKINILKDMEKKICTEDHNRIIRDICAWYRENKRDLPWRQSRDPYRVWVSEIMLQQTRVEAVIPYYRRFLEALPEVKALAECPEEKLLKLWEGLGYYSRVRNMQKAAREVMENHGGRIPLEREALLMLSGIGSYTAGAIASIAGGEAVPAVDGNVLRVYSRLFADERDVRKEKTKKAVTEELTLAMKAFFSGTDDLPGEFNQGLMDLGAGVCLPNGQPLCEACPCRLYCRAHEDGCETSLPVRAPQKARRIEDRTVLLITDTDKVAIRKRPATGLLAGLYEFPNYLGNLTDEESLAIVEARGLVPLHIQRIENAKHIFSHIEWHMQAYEVRIASFDREGREKPEAEDWILAGRQEIQARYAIPSAFGVYAEHVRLMRGPFGDSAGQTDGEAVVSTGNKALTGVSDE